MNPLVTLRLAVRAIRRNAMRSFLTALGIIIGVSAVIAMVAMGEGAKSMVQDAFNSMGSNMLIVMPGSSQGGGVRGGFGSMATLTWEDYRAIGREISTVKYVSPNLRSSEQLASEEQNWNTSINGVSPAYFPIRNLNIAKGSAFTDSDVEAQRKVVLLGQTVVDNLFGKTSDPVGQTIRIKKIPFLVIGVLQKKGQSPMGQDFDDIAIIPYTTFQSKIQNGLQKFVSGVLVVGAESAESTYRAEKQITALLRDRHRLADSADDDFSVRNLTEMAEASESGTKTLTTLLAGIAAVSLLVGGIGIMNIMLVSVTERTREIGLRMAVGAKPRHILLQFLIEALTLSLGGGLIGVVLGLWGAHAIAAQFSWPFLVRTDIILIAVFFSAMVGVVFGIYPAYKASRLDPITALHYE